MHPESVCPDDSEEWEEQYVFVELVGMVDPDKLTLCTKDNSAILGVDGETTVLKLGGHVFAGTYEDAMGTVVFFEETGDRKSLSLKYLCHANKVLRTSRAFLKCNIDESSNNVESTEIGVEQMPQPPDENNIDDESVSKIVLDESGSADNNVNDHPI